jgi:hypothetical protein
MIDQFLGHIWWLRCRIWWSRGGFVTAGDIAVVLRGGEADEMVGKERVQELQMSLRPQDISVE